MSVILLATKTIIKHFGQHYLPTTDNILKFIKSNLKYNLPRYLGRYIIYTVYRGRV
jgi:hypothetical protein